MQVNSLRHANLAVLWSLGGSRMYEVWWWSECGSSADKERHLGQRLTFEPDSRVTQTMCTDSCHPGSEGGVGIEGSRG
jgi:hypothetical protein